MLALGESLVAVRVAQRLGGEGGDDLDESHVGVGKRRPVAERAQENRADGDAAPIDRHDRDRLDPAAQQIAAHVLETGIVGGIGDEHGLGAVDRALQLGIPLQIHEVVADRGIFVRGDEAYLLAAPLGEEDRAAIQSERFAQLARDGLQDVDEVQRPGDFLENLDHREQVLAFVLELGNPGRQPLTFRLAVGGGNGHGA